MKAQKFLSYIYHHVLLSNISESRRPGYELPSARGEEDDKPISLAIPFSSLAAAKKGDLDSVSKFGKFDLDSIMLYAASRRQLVRSFIIYRGMTE